MTKTEKYIFLISLAGFLFCCVIINNNRNRLLKRVLIVNKPYDLEFYHIRNANIPNGVQIRLIQRERQSIMQHHQGYHEVSVISLEEGKIKIALKGILGRRDTVYQELP